MKVIMKWKTPLIYSLLALYLLLIAAFYFSYMKSSDKLEALDKQYSEKEAMISRVQAMVQQKAPATALTDAERLAGETAIPNLPRIEMLIRAVKQYQADAGVKLSSLSFGGAGNSPADKAAANNLAPSATSTNKGPVVSSDPLVNGLNSAASALLGDQKTGTASYGLSKVEISVSISGSYEAIKQFIAKLQSSPRLITVSSLSLTGASISPALTELQTDMTAELALTAYYLPSAAPAAAK